MPKRSPPPQVPSRLLAPRPKRILTSAQRLALETFRNAIGDRQKYRRDFASHPLDFFKRFGYKFPPKCRELFDGLYSGKLRKVVDLRGRGNGKSQNAANIAFAKFFFQDWDVLIIGGSLDQSDTVAGYVSDYTADVNVQPFIEDESRLLVRGTEGNWIRAVAASRKAIRSKHPRGRPILLILDEMGEMADDIIQSAYGTITDASESQVLCCSTYHQVLGEFAEMVDDPEEFGAVLFTLNSFEIGSRCTDDCDHCFDNYPNLKPELRRKYTAEFRDIDCRGRLHEGEGWMKPDAIRKARVDFRFREKFEVEVLGMRPSGEGSVLPSDKVKFAFERPERAAFVTGVTPVAGVDWGFKSGGSQGLEICQFPEAAGIHWLESYSWDHTLEEAIRDELLRFEERYGVRPLIKGDISHPYGNARLTDWGYDVEEINFNTFAQRGAGALKHFFEDGAVLIGGDDWREQKEQCLTWKRDKAGRLLTTKKHHCAALLCASKHACDLIGGKITIGSIPIGGDNVEATWDQILNQGERDFDRLANAVDI